MAAGSVALACASAGTWASQHHHPPAQPKDGAARRATASAPGLPRPRGSRRLDKVVCTRAMMGQPGSARPKQVRSPMR